MPTPHYIPGFIVEYPRRVEFKAQSDLSDCRVPFTATSWAAFVAENEFGRDEADALALRLAITGSALFGGGAAPVFYIRKG